MDQDAIKNVLREALREEAEKIASCGTADQIRARMTLLFAGAETRLTERVENMDLGLTHSSPYFNRGRAIADSIEL